jgi:hypothetical protein
MGEYVDFLISAPSPQQIARDMDLKNNLKCKHDIIAEWCATCKRLDSPSIKQILLEENLEIVRNLLSWPKKSGNHTT